MTRIAIIEVTDFHDECIYSHVKFLEHEKHKISLICNDKLKDRVKEFKGIDKFIFLDLSTKAKKYKAWFHLWKLISNNYSKVIFNTGEVYISKLLLFPFKNVEFVGVLHNAHKLRRKNKF